MIHDDILGTIGRTPLVRLRRVIPPGCASVVAKLEFFAPGGSVKDRAASAMLLGAERSGLIKPGSTIVEASAGNTGIGLAIVCAVRGYRCIICLPETTSRDKRAILEILGAELVLTRADVEPGHDEGYIGRAASLARERGAYMPDQFENPENPQSHYDTTGPEILADCDGELDAFVSCVGSGGTLHGVGRYLRERVPPIQIIGAAPEAGRKDAQSLVEGIVADITSCSMQGPPPDRVITIPDQEALAMTLRLAREEGILAGGSSGVAVCAAIQVAQQIGAGRRVAVIIPDTARNYISTYFDEAWRGAHGL